MSSFINNDLSVIILAAGKGTRMKSSLPKVMHKITGREMINLVIDEAKLLHPSSILVVVSDEMDQYSALITKEHHDSNLFFVTQKQRLGTAHAVKTAIDFASKQSIPLAHRVLILYGDTPMISANSLNKILQRLDFASVCLMAFSCSYENSYGRLVIDGGGCLDRVVEFKDAKEDEKKLTLCNSGVVAIDGKKIVELINEIQSDNKAGEFYLTDIIGIAKNFGLARDFVEVNGDELLGVNSRSELANLERFAQNKLRIKAMDSGVTMLDPESAFLSFDTKFGCDIVIEPNVFFGPKVEVGNEVQIKSFSHLEGVVVESGVTIGPFARIRPGTILKKEVKIGNFVELKNATVETGAKINHLSYIGDSLIGEASNIGAGVVTCNYDGHNKYQTRIGKKVFVGSNSALVAPLEIEDGALIGAGSVITKFVAKDDMAIARARQVNLPLAAKKFRNNKGSKK